MFHIEPFDEGDFIFFLPDALFVQADVDEYSIIAIRLRMSKTSKVAFWSDTMRERSLAFESYQIYDDKIVFVTSNQDKWIFSPLTLEIYHRIKNKLVPLINEPLNDEELQTYYSNTNFNAF